MSSQTITQVWNDLDDCNPDAWELNLADQEILRRDEAASIHPQDDGTLLVLDADGDAIGFFGRRVQDLEVLDEAVEAHLLANRADAGEGF